MATTPTTIIVFTEDPVNLPINDLLLVIKELFQYGVREIKASGDKIFVKLTYSPRAATLKRKFGLLPIKYLRTKLDKDAEFQVLERIVKKYRFNLLDEQLEDINRQQAIKDRPGTSGGGGGDGGGSMQKKRKLYLEPPVLQHVEEDEEDEEEKEEEHEEQPRQMHTVGATPSSAAASTSTGRRGGDGGGCGDNDDDDILLLSQNIF
ncbi:unnamed protein product [Acanthoscelides obtectus]|uniref:Uncharacterized protein n=1 Tax=Acanthoscelides obtectus TaxID=200917 RepID=A0A9P0KYK3_ACAOB|nr:unnamed protein product [Acanthoscelides obtectus]CAK1680871.1 hypothetical protein AOBTE_LOCUS32916 [Acanthoscelides obtectus]